MITYKLVPFHTIGKYVAQNAKNHHSNMLEEQIAASPKIDWEYYLSASHQGQCVAGVIQVNGEPKGYSVFIIDKDPMNKDRTEATSQALYIENDYRRYVQKFLKECNRLLTDGGVDSISYIFGNERLGKLMSRVGFKNKYTVWSIDNG